MLKLLILTFLCFSCSLALPRSLGSFGLSSVSFLNIERWNSTSPWMLLASTFGVFSGNGLWIVNDLGATVGAFNKTTPRKITSDLAWPNEARVIPAGTIKGYDSLLSVCYGFLVPTVTTGGVKFIDMNNGAGTIHKISTDKSGFFYHRLRWFDIDGDGLQDFFTCRANRPFFGDPSGELVWFKQPAQNPLGTAWETFHLEDGCDFLWEAMDLDNDGVPEIIAAEFFGQQLTVVYPEGGDWRRSISIKRLIIDATIGPGFEVREYARNATTGFITHIIVTNHIGDPTGAVFVYEIPANWKSEPWTRHVITKGFTIRQPGNNQAAPGSPFPFYPKKGMSGKPWVVLSGDGSQYAYQLAPQGSGWEFQRSLLVDTKATVGQIAVEDVDDDGYAEIFVPAYDTGIVYGFSYSPTKD